jgi:hypothetical protein
MFLQNNLPDYKEPKHKNHNIDLQKLNISHQDYVKSANTDLHIWLSIGQLTNLMIFQLLVFLLSHAE